MSTYQTLPKISNWQIIKIGIVLLFCLSLFPINNFWQLNSSFNKVITSIIHRDQTLVKIPERQVKPKIVLIYKNLEGKTVRVLADKEKYSEFVNTQVKNLELARQQIAEQAQQQFTEGLNLIFNKIKDRIPQFADWYYAYGTQYQLLWESINSAIHHLKDDNIRELVSSDLEKIIIKHYEYETLKPELTQSELEQLYSEVLNKIHQSYLKVIANFDDQFQLFISEQTSYLDCAPSPVELNVDWNAQLHKLRIAPDATFTLGGLRSILFATVGGMMGKSLGLVFASRAMVMVAGGTVGTGAGPVGTVIGATVGATVGIAADWLLHQGTEILSRSQFEIEVLESVNATEKTIQNKLLPSLLDTINVQHNDLVQLILKF